MARPPPALKSHKRYQDADGPEHGGALQDQLHMPLPLNHGTWTGLTLSLAARAIVNPRLAMDLLRMVWAFRTRHWYKRLPFLPIPPRTYMRWRMYTAYGDEDAVPSIDDVVRFARWRREVMHL
jgi:hypothetical protein